MNNLGARAAAANESASLAARGWTWLALVGWVTLCLSAGVIGSLFRPGDWYVSLQKPSWNPPSWVFGPVWTTLYCLMGVSAWLVWKKAGLGWHGRWRWFFAQLALNALWSPLFFGLQRPGLALAEIVLLWGAILGTAISFARQSRWAAALLVPYLAWVSFATVLNFTLWRLNG